MPEGACGKFRLVGLVERQAASLGTVTWKQRHASSRSSWPPWTNHIPQQGATVTPDRRTLLTPKTPARLRTARSTPLGYCRSGPLLRTPYHGSALFGTILFGRQVLD